MTGSRVGSRDTSPVTPVHMHASPRCPSGHLCSDLITAVSFLPARCGTGVREVALAVRLGQVGWWVMSSPGPGEETGTALTRHLSPKFLTGVHKDQVEYVPEHLGKWCDYSDRSPSLIFEHQNLIRSSLSLEGCCL